MSDKSSEGFEKNFNALEDGNPVKPSGGLEMSLAKYWFDMGKQEKLQAAEENLTECASNYWKEVEKRKAAEEEIFLLRMIAYAYKNLDCHSSPEAIEAITAKGWQAQLNYEKWWLNNKGDVHFKDWKELEQVLEKVGGGE